MMGITLSVSELTEGVVPEMQAYTINGHKVAFLRTRPVPREAKAGPMCVCCSRGIQVDLSWKALAMYLRPCLGAYRI